MNAKDQYLRNANSVYVPSSLMERVLRHTKKRGSDQGPVRISDHTTNLKLLTCGKVSGKPPWLFSVGIESSVLTKNIQSERRNSSVARSSAPRTTSSEITELSMAFERCAWSIRSNVDGVMTGGTQTLTSLSAYSLKWERTINLTLGNISRYLKWTTHSEYSDSSLNLGLQETKCASGSSHFIICSIKQEYLKTTSLNSFSNKRGTKATTTN